MKKKPAAKTSKKASTKRQQIIVLMDGAKNYYELPRSTFERIRVVDDRRREEIEKKLQARPGEFWYIDAPCIPGSIVAPPFEGGCQIHYAGFYLTSAKAKR